MRLRWVVLVLILPAAPGWADGSVRALLADRKQCWAAGDAGMILRSDDAGETWQQCPAAAVADLHGIFRDNTAVLFFGGRGIPGHPAGAGQAVILRTVDAGQTFAALYPPQTGWLYGGAAAGQHWAVFGQACPLSPAGAWTSDSAGQTWQPLQAAGRGPLLAGAFHRGEVGHLVGAEQRAVRLEGLRTPANVPLSASAASLRAVAFGDPYAWWAVGDNGTVVQGGVQSGPWKQVALALPPRARRLADFCAVAAASPREVWVGGGLLGRVHHTTDAGKTWQGLAAPAPGPVHTLCYLPPGVLLAGGDAGRLWRSTDRGATWKLVHGPDATDVLFVLTPADKSLWPAVVAHAVAGLNVGVVWASRPPDDAFTAADQPLRSAAARAGAGGAIVLHDFLSAAVSESADTLTGGAVRQAWRRLIEVDAEPEIVLQLAAAIRLYRPAVLAIGPDREGGGGRELEARMMARLARKAMATAAEPANDGGLAQVGLKPFRPQRLFVADLENNDWQPLWEPAQAASAQDGTAFAAGYFIAGHNEPLELLVQRALWQLPWFGLTDRPAARCLYRGDQTRSAPLFTAGLRQQVLRLTDASALQRRLAAGLDLRGRPTAAIPAFAKAADDAETAVLAADRAILGWWSLSQAGRLPDAQALLAVALRHGQKHPLYQRVGVTAMAVSASAEWHALAAGADRAPRLSPQAAGAVADQLARWPAWAVTPEGRVLHSRLLSAAGRDNDARLALRKLADGDQYPRDWRDFARAELAVMAGATANADLPRSAHAVEAKADLRLDGRLDEEFWKRAFTYRLGRPNPTTSAPGPAGQLQAVRVKDSLVLGIRLPGDRPWGVTVAIDADRDAWTQTVLQFDTAGRREARTEVRMGPSAVRHAALFGIQARSEEPQANQDAGAYVFELAIPFHHLGVPSASHAAWRFQVLAVGKGDDAGVQLFFQPQADALPAPHRYGLLFVPGGPGDRI